MDDNKLLYMLVVIAAVGVLSLLLRALPFLLFARSQGKMPPLASFIGSVLSPAAIAMLCVYCFSGNLASLSGGASLYIAAWAGGALTVALHLWRGNPLLSILSGTLLYMTLLRLL